MADPAALRSGGVPEHFNLPWHLALASGDLADLPVSWTDQPGGTGQMLAALEAGELDVVSILTEGTVAAIADGLPATIVQVYVASPLQWGIHVPAGSGWTDPDAFAGPRVAISRPRSGSHLMAAVAADRRGWSLTDDGLVEVGGLDGARETAASGSWDVFLWDRFMTQSLVDEGVARRIGIEPTPWPPFVIAVRDEVLLGRTTEVGRLVDAVVAAAGVLHRRSDVVDLLGERYGLDPVSARAWLDVTEFAPRGAPDPGLAPDVAARVERALGR